MSRVLEEAEEVALARWEATEPPSSRKQRTQDALLAQAEALIKARWAATQPSEPADIQSQVAESPRPWNQTTYRLFDTSGNEIKCHLCGKPDQWIPEGDEERQRVRMFVCEHDPIRLGSGLVRQVATVSLHRILRIEPSKPP